MNEITRIYNLSDSELVQLSDKFKNLFKRDASKFEDYAYETNSTISKLDELRAEFDKIKSDNWMQSVVVAKNQRRDELSTELNKLLTSIRVRAKVIWGEKSAKYRTMPALSKANFAEQVRIAGHYIESMENYMDELSKRNITQETLNEVKTLRQQLDTAIDECTESISNRDIATELRRMKGNDLWTFISELAEIGKNLYRDDEAKYNDYVLYKRSPKTKDTLTTETVDSEDKVEA